MLFCFILFKFLCCYNVEGCRHTGKGMQEVHMSLRQLITNVCSFVPFENTVLYETPSPRYDFLAMDTAQKTRALRLFMRVSILILLFFGTFNSIYGSFTLGVIELFFALLTGVLLYFATHYKCLKTVSYLFIFFTGWMVWIVVFADSTRPHTVIWISVFPVISYYLLGLKKGTVAYILFSLTILATFWIREDSFDAAVAHGGFNLVSSMLALGLYIFLYEYGRSEALGFAVSRSMFDDLTGAGTRKLFHLIFRQTQAYIQRHNHKASILLADLDRFKHINDTYGHVVGDTVLSTFAHLIQSHIRSNDTLVRWGGEEFMIIAPDTDAEHARELAEKLRRTIQTHPFDTVGHITASFGITQVDPNDSEESAVRRADEALYRAKENGRNRIESA
jgi:diguanylate cyclase (GGDEF)-like protein